MKDAQKAGLVVNWIGRQCVMTLHSISVKLDKPKTVFDSLEKILRLESNQTLSHFKFRGLKQKATQSCYSYMSELRLAIVECRYPDIVQDELLKDQFIFGLVIKEIQYHLLIETVVEDSSEKCLLESRKVELKIEQRKLLGIKAAISYDSVQTNRGREKFRRAEAEEDPQVPKEIANIVERVIVKEIVQLLARGAKSVLRTFISK